MSNIVKFDAPELNSIEPSKAEQIRNTFEPMAVMLEGFEQSYNSIMTEKQNGITGELTAKAKRLRLDISKIRIETEKVRKSQKEEYLRAGKAIDGVSNILQWAIGEKEGSLKEIENYFENQEKERLEKLQSERVELLSPYLPDAGEKDLSSMLPDVWDAYFAAKKKDYEDRIEAEKKAEQERIERERKEAEEREKQRLENIRLKKEAEEREKAAEAERKKQAEILAKQKDEAEKKQREIEEKARKEREESERILLAERKAAAEKLEKEIEQARKLAAELQAKKDAELKAKMEAENLAKQALLAPDKTKLLGFAKVISGLQLPEVKSEESKRIITDTKILLDKVVVFINSGIEKLK